MKQIRRVNYNDPQDALALQQLMQCYALDPMGGAQALDEKLITQLPVALAQRMDAVSFLAWHGKQAVGLINAFEGFSTFAVRPLLNIHDLIVHPEFRGQGIAEQLLSACESHALQRRCCKLTLEVLSNNQTAKKIYQRYGFAAYQLQQSDAHAEFWQKNLKIESNHEKS